MTGLYRPVPEKYWCYYLYLYCSTLCAIICVNHPQWVNRQDVPRPCAAASLQYYSDVILGAIASQVTNLTITCSTVYSDADQRKHQSSASLAFVRGIHRWPVNSPHKWPVTRKMFPFDDVIMRLQAGLQCCLKAIDANALGSACRIYFRDCPIKSRHNDNIVQRHLYYRLLTLRGFNHRIINTVWYHTTQVECWYQILILTRYTLKLDLTSELWIVYCKEWFGNKWQRDYERTFVHFIILRHVIHGNVPDNRVKVSLDTVINISGVENCVIC